MNLEKDVFAGLVTSMAFLTDSILLVGQGPWLKAFDVRNGELLAKSLVLPANRIHRLVLEPRGVNDEGTYAQRRKILAYGAKTLAVLTIEYNIGSSSQLTDQSSHHAEGNDNQKTEVVIRQVQQYGPFTDWIQDVQWLYEDDESGVEATKIAMAFAHNFVEVYDITAERPSRVFRVQCEEQCILYSARFFGNTLSTLYLGSGTVFNEVHVWKVSDKNEEGFAPVQHRLVGHDGVIFGIRFSDDGSLLVSVSDDRTIRVWGLKDQKRKYHVIFGHTARIWDCIMVDQYLVSVSEDTTCRVWNNPYLQEEDEQSDSAMDCLACWEGHAGKNVWSCAVSPNKRLVATGGQDSGVRLWSLKAIQENHIESESDLTAIDLPELESYAPQLEDANEFMRNFVIVDYDVIATFTNQGFLLRYDNDDQKWTALYQDDDFQNYAVMEACREGQFVVSGGLQGHLSICHAYSAFTPLKLKVHNSKVLSVFIFESKDKGVFYIVSIGMEDEFYLFRFDMRIIDEPKIRLVHRLQRSEIKTTIICATISEDDSLLLCGSRESALLIYRIPGIHKDASAEDQPTLSTLALQLRRTHGRQAVSSVLVRPLPETSSHSPGLIVLTTGRDGCFIEYRLLNIASSATEDGPNMDIDADKMDLVDDDDDSDEGQEKKAHGKSLLIEKVYKNRVTKGWAEGAMYMDGELYILGFFRKRFFVFNVAKGFEMLSVACGGAHRAWHFLNDDRKLAKCTFAFFRRNKVNTLFRKCMPSTETFEASVQSNFHGKDVRAITFLGAAIGCQEKFKNMPMIVATGGEDTLLRLSQYVPGDLEGSLISLRTVRKHSSVIKSIVYSIGKETLLFTSGASEELRCWKLDSHPPQGTLASDFDPSKDLLDISCLELAASPLVSDIKETRIMDTSVFCIDAHRGYHILAAAYSDSTTRLWLFDEVAKKFYLIADGVWHMKCLLQIQHLLVEDNAGGQGIIIITSATDGKLAFWNATSVVNQFIESYKAGAILELVKLPEPFYSYQAHLSGVNAIDIKQQEDGSFWLASGGEDNAFALNWLDIRYDSREDVPASATAKADIAKIEGAHASSITGVHIVNRRVLTVSTDQRLNVWDVDTTQGVKLSLGDAHYIDVPDPSAMDVTVHNDTIVVGVTGIGFQLLKSKKLM
ncbi:hypothetical protein K450DRAFT_240091 [Umbelopsis ramanniana AG]|uniref:WD repeat-containing protein 6 n=1 Tax=Umbelopsis ramanniana AG TaxID=1314678 RepID=A0AAD5EAL1_UMBRA|nr:uncharacterized protein K450DRAFT_240091 [Umbelopsis ramanniana AG]KAI8579739.1 hypothetical protein K450DRAFT_240091 [Umbelopsis ramanniana AG]